MTEYPMLDDKLATLRNAIEGGVKADTMQAMKLMELVDAIGEQFKREVEDASAPAADAGARLTDNEKADILDWVSACQSAYHIDSTPGHRFGGLGSNLEENRSALIDCIESTIAQRAALSVKADALVDPTIAAAVKTRIYPADFTDDLQWILGLMCFQCISYAQALRKGGRPIPTKAEAEQAATLDYLLRHYLRDPENWRETASAELRAMMSDSATASDKEGA